MMPAYDFKDTESGEVVELVMPMADAVPIGDLIERDGRELMRLPSDAIVEDQGFGGTWQYPTICPSLSGGIPGVKYTRKGCAIITSPRQHRNVAAQLGLEFD